MALTRAQYAEFLGEGGENEMTRNWRTWNAMLLCSPRMHVSEECQKREAIRKRDSREIGDG